MVVACDGEGRCRGSGSIRQFLGKLHTDGYMSIRLFIIMAKMVFSLRALLSSWCGAGGIADWSTDGLAESWCLVELRVGAGYHVGSDGVLAFA